MFNNGNIAIIDIGSDKIFNKNIVDVLLTKNTHPTHRLREYFY